MCDLKNIEKNFHKLIENTRSRYCWEDFEYPTLTKDLLKKEEYFWSQGGYGVIFFYFLKYEDDNCQLYVNAFDGNFNELFIIDDDSYKWIKNEDYQKILSECNIEYVKRD